METPWKVILAFLGVFVAGAVFGGFFSLGIGRRIWTMEAPAPAKAVAGSAVSPTGQPSAPGQPAPPPRPPQSVQSAQILRRITNQLDLTAAQKAQVTPIIARAVQDFWRQQQNFARENGFLLQRLKQDIGRELTSDQQKRLDDLWLKQLEQLRKRQEEAQAQRRAEAQALAAPKPAGTPAELPAPPAKAPAGDDEAKPPAPASKPPGGEK